MGIDNVLTALLMSGILESLASDSITEVYRLMKKKLAGDDERLKDAKESYDKREKDPASPLELQRNALLAKSTSVQTDALLTIAHQVSLNRLLTALMELTAQTYEAISEQELKFVELGYGRLEGAIDNYKKMLRNRAAARIGAIVVSVLALVGLGFLVYYGSTPNGPKATDLLQIIQLPIGVLVWSSIGSFAAILYRFNNSGDIELQDPLRWLFTRPLTGIVMGTISYFVLKVGFLSLNLGKDVLVGSPEIVWLLAFISGFSDRFADNLLKTLAGKFAGDKKDALVNLDPIVQVETLPSLTLLVEELVGYKRKKEKKPKPEVSQSNSDAQKPGKELSPPQSNRLEQSIMDDQE